MMYDSFFMEKTIGDFAEEKLRKLIQKRLEKNSKKKQKLIKNYVKIFNIYSFILKK